MKRVLLTTVLLLGACQETQSTRRPPTPPWLRPSVTRRIVEPESDPAQLVPGDARWYVQIDNLAGWLSQRQGDPLVEHLWKVARSYQPPRMLGNAARKLGLSEQDTIATFFSGPLAVVDQEIAGVHGVVIMTRAPEPALRALPRALGLSPLGSPERIGPFEIYSGWDGPKEYAYAIGRRWLMMSKARHADHLRRMTCAVAAGAAPLTSNSKFNALVSELPPSHRDALILARDGKNNGDHHAMIISRDGAALSADYAADAPRLMDYLKDVQELDGVDFGPLPESVILAATIGVLHRSVPGAGLFNMMLFPQNFKDDVRPGIAPPVVVFLASLPRDRVKPDPGVQVPVLGLAVRLSNPATARQLDRIVRGVHFLMSTARLDLAAGFFGVRQVKRDDLEYQVADFGPALQKNVGDKGIRKIANLPSSAGLTKITFGRIGDYYLLCSQEEFFLDWARAARNPSLRLSSGPEFRGFALEDRPHLILSFLTRAPQLSELLHQVADYWRKANESAPPPPEPSRPGENAKAPAKKPEKTDSMEQPIRWVADGLRLRESFSLQLWRGQSKRLYGQLRITPPSGPTASPEPRS